MSNRTGNTELEKTNVSYGLKDQVLSSWEVISQSVANIAPTATPALVIPLVFAVAGGATWVAYIFATIATLLVALSINVFAKRSASPGSFYTYIADSFGPIWGTIIGWIQYGNLGREIFPGNLSGQNSLDSARGIHRINR